MALLSGLDVAFASDTFATTACVCNAACSIYATSWCPVLVPLPVRGFTVPKDLTRADDRASWATMVGLLARMHTAGVPIVAGTDGSGIEIIHELEIYIDAGFSPAEALAAATIVPARLVGPERHTGSIAVGKVADLVLIEGDPSVRIGDLRHTRVVMLDGKLLEGDALWQAAASRDGRRSVVPTAVCALGTTLGTRASRAPYAHRREDRRGPDAHAR